MEVLSPGSRLGRYRLDEWLGIGGMGIVVGGWDELLQRPVALKVLTADDASSVVAEARAMAAVRHPNVVTIYSIEQEGPRTFVVMERIDGTSLDAVLLERRTLEPQAVVRIVFAVAEALAEIHRAGVLHGDVKPSNILVEQPSGRIVVTDFGLAIGLDRESERAQVRGTPEYICPERACGLDVAQALRPRQDIYALACTAYELLTGRPPYEGRSGEEILLAHVHSDIPRACELEPTLPWRVDMALSAALAKDPAQRTPTAEHFAADLAFCVQRGNEPPRVLLAEDEPDERRFWAEVLAKKMRGTQLLSVSDGESAYRAATAQRPDLVLVDLGLPRMNGMELAATLRTTPGLETVPIVVLSGAVSNTERRLLARLGIHDVLLKPVAAARVVEVVCRLLSLDLPNTSRRLKRVPSEVPPRARAASR